MISITERRTRLYIPVIRENNGISSTARHHRIGDWNLNLPEGLSERNGQPLISERIAWRAAHQLICQLGGRVAGWGCFDKIYRKFRICDVRSIPHSPTTQTIHSIVAMLDTLKLLRFCMKLVKFSKFTWVTRTFDLCGEFFFGRYSKMNHWPSWLWRLQNFALISQISTSPQSVKASLDVGSDDWRTL